MRRAFLISMGVFSVLFLIKDLREKKKELKACLEEHPVKKKEPKPGIEAESFRYL